MEVKGKVAQLLPLTTGMGKKGPWKKQEFILETQGQYPKKICFSIWGEKVDQFNVAVGDLINVSVDLESREYNGQVVYRGTCLEDFQGRKPEARRRLQIRSRFSPNQRQPTICLSRILTYSEHGVAVDSVDFGQINHQNSLIYLSGRHFAIIIPQKFSNSRYGCIFDLPGILC